jgi:uncharacterized membrane protein
MLSSAGFESRMTDERLNTIIGNLLRAGVLVSAAIVLAAGIFYLIQHHSETPNYSEFHREPTNLRTLSEIFRSALSLRADAIIQLGLVILIATPIARVVLAAIGFYLEGDRLYVVISITVLAILIFSITHAI